MYICVFCVSVWVVGIDQVQSVRWYQLAEQIEIRAQLTM